MEGEESKHSNQRIPITHFEQVNSDFVLALALQEQERAYTLLEAIESDTEENESDVSSSENNNLDADFFESQGFLAELEFLEGEDSNTDEDMEEDNFDPDELSYEELIALGEFIGEEKRGLSLNEISSCSNPIKYQKAENKSGIERCVVCQIEYEEGEALVALPCEHPYHSDCISKWLQIKKICPICSTEVSSSIAKTT